MAKHRIANKSKADCKVAPLRDRVVQFALKTGSIVKYSALVSVDLSDARLALVQDDLRAASTAVSAEMGVVQPSLLRELKQLLGCQVNKCFIPDIDGVEHELERVLQLAFRRHVVSELEQWPNLSERVQPGYDAQGTTLVIVVSQTMPQIQVPVGGSLRMQPKHPRPAYWKAAKLDNKLQKQLVALRVSSAAQLSPEISEILLTNKGIQQLEGTNSISFVDIAAGDLFTPVPTKTWQAWTEAFEIGDVDSEQDLHQLSLLYRAQKIGEAQDAVFKEEVKKISQVDRLRPASFLRSDGFAKSVAEAYGTACSTYKTGTTARWHLLADFVSQITTKDSELAPEKKAVVVSALGPLSAETGQRPAMTISSGRALVSNLRALYDTETCFFKTAVFSWLAAMQIKLDQYRNAHSAKLNSYQPANLEGVRKKPRIRSSPYELEELFTDAAASSHMHAIAMFTKYLHSFEEVEHAVEGDTAGSEHTAAQKLNVDYLASPDMVKQIEEQMRTFMDSHARTGPAPEPTPDPAPEPAPVPAPELPGTSCGHTPAAPSQAVTVRIPVAPTPATAPQYESARVAKRSADMVPETEMRAYSKDLASDEAESEDDDNNEELEEYIDNQADGDATAQNVHSMQSVSANHDVPCEAAGSMSTRGNKRNRRAMKDSTNQPTASFHKSTRRSARKHPGFWVDT